MRSHSKPFLKDVAFSDSAIKHMSRKMAYACVSEGSEGFTGVQLCLMILLS